MQKINKKQVSYLSSNGKDTIQGFVYNCEEINPKAIIQLSHGMCEYISRYDDFAFFLVDNGYVVCGNDHLGHGETSTANGIDGFFAEEYGDKFVLEDLHTMTSLIKDLYPNLPVILLGHSMGSFFARQYAITYPEDINGLIISGTGGPNPLSSVGLMLTSMLSKIKGATYRSKFIDNLATGSYYKKIKNANTKYDWISDDKDIIEKYANDSKCTYMFTVSAYHDLMTVLKEVNTQKWADKLDKKMPIYIFSGKSDPVGDCYKGVLKVYQLIKNANVENVTLKGYENGLHEMLNSTNRKQVYNDVLNWINNEF